MTETLAARRTELERLSDEQVRALLRTWYEPLPFATREDNILSLLQEEFGYAAVKAAYPAWDARIDELQAEHERRQGQGSLAQRPSLAEAREALIRDLEWLLAEYAQAAASADRQEAAAWERWMDEIERRLAQTQRLSGSVPVDQNGRHRAQDSADNTAAEAGHG